MAVASFGSVFECAKNFTFSTTVCSEISYAEKEGASDTATISLSNLDSAADSGDGTFCLQFKAGSKLSGSRAGKTVDKLIFKAPDTRAWAETTTGALTTFRENGGGNNQAGPSTGVPEEEAEEATPAGKGKLQLMIPAGAVDITPGVTPENSGLLSTPRGQSDGRLTPPKAATPSPRAMRVSGGFDYLGGGGTPQRPATPGEASRASRSPTSCPCTHCVHNTYVQWKMGAPLSPDTLTHPPLINFHQRWQQWARRRSTRDGTPTGRRP